MLEYSLVYSIHACCTPSNVLNNKVRQVRKFSLFLKKVVMICTNAFYLPEDAVSTIESYKIMYQLCRLQSINSFNSLQLGHKSLFRKKVFILENVFTVTKVNHYVSSVSTFFNYCFRTYTLIVILVLL